MTNQITNNFTTINSLSLKCFCTYCYNQKNSTCTIPYTNFSNFQPICYVADTYKKHEEFKIINIVKREQGCLGGSFDINPDFHCERSEIDTYYDVSSGEELTEFIYCCSEDYCNQNATSHISKSYFSSTFFTTSVTTPYTSGNIVKLILPSVLIPLVCTFVFLIAILLLILSWRHRRISSNNVYKIDITRNTSKRRQPYISGMRVMSGTMHTELYPLSSLISGDTTISSSATGIPLLELRTIGRQIQLTRVIGKGRFGTVHLGNWKGHDVAVKIFYTHNEDSWKHEAHLFRTCMLRHINILGFIAADMKDDNGSIQLWLVTDYHPNGSLYDYLRNNTLKEEAATKLCLSLVTGLAFLHEEIKANEAYKPAIAHRDIKSRNVLVRNDGECCIGDLGLAIREAYDEDYRLAEPRQGTKRYMSPEALIGKLDLHQIESLKQSDIYSLGLVLWEIGLKWSTTSDVFEPDHECSQLPYEENIPSDPSLEDILQIVVVSKKRPTLPVRWLANYNLSKLSNVLYECWYVDPMARLTAHKIKQVFIAICNQQNRS